MIMLICSVHVQSIDANEETSERISFSESEAHEHTHNNYISNEDRIQVKAVFNHD